MGSVESTSSSDQSETGRSNTTTALPTNVDRVRPGFVWVIALAAGVVAGLVAWLAGESVHGAFQPQVFEVKVALTTFIQPTNASLNAADVKNATLVFTILGGVTGLAMGIAGGLAGRSLRRSVLVGLGGLLAGGLVGALVSMGLLPFFFRRVVPDPNDLMSPILIHAGIWMAIGTVGGLAFAIGMRCWQCIFNATAGGCLGALLATLVFHGLSEAFFADSGSTAPVATSALARLLAVFLITVLIACGAARGALSLHGRKSSRLTGEL
jgi:hypothetical protein